MASPILYYTASCPACTRYINHLKNIDKDGELHFQDIEKNKEGLALSDQEAVKQPLARDSEGNLQHGVDALLTAWEALPYYRMLVPSLRISLLKMIFTLYYQTYAEWRPTKHTCYRYHGCSTRTERHNKNKAR